jgi:hypothetical protein
MEQSYCLLCEAISIILSRKIDRLRMHTEKKLLKIT